MDLLATDDFDFIDSLKGSLDYIVRITPTKNSEKNMNAFLHCCWGCKMVQPQWKTAWRFLKKLKIELTSDLEISTLGIYLKKRHTNCKIYMHYNVQ